MVLARNWCWGDSGVGLTVVLLRQWCLADSGVGVTVVLVLTVVFG